MGCPVGNPHPRIPLPLRHATRQTSSDRSLSNGTTLGASIVDPHGDLADAKAKLRGLADYADRFGDRYVRIESVARLTDGRLRVLDLKEEKVRAAVRAFEGGKITALYEGDCARDYA